MISEGGGKGAGRWERRSKLPPPQGHAGIGQHRGMGGIVHVGSTILLIDLCVFPAKKPRNWPEGGSLHQPKKNKGRKLLGDDMTGRPGYRTMEMIGANSASHLAHTPCVPLFCTLFNRGGNRRVLRLAGEGSDHFHCTVEPSPGHIRCRETIVQSSYQRACQGNIGC